MGTVHFILQCNTKCNKIYDPLLSTYVQWDVGEKNL